MIPHMHRSFAVAATIVTALSLAWGFYLVGSPSARRLERFDDQRVRDLQTIARQIQWMVEDPNEKGVLKSELPASLEQAANKAVGEQLNLRDPETGAPYGYRIPDESTYELCANFSQPRDASVSVFWNHPAGEHCFRIDARKPPPLY
jgi:hypothetical protein